MHYIIGVYGDALKVVYLQRYSAILVPVLDVRQKACLLGRTSKLKGKDKLHPYKPRIVDMNFKFKKL